MIELSNRSPSAIDEHGRYIEQLKASLRVACDTAPTVTRDEETGSFVEFIEEFKNDAIKMREDYRENGFLTLTHEDRQGELTIDNLHDYAFLVKMACRQLYYADDTTDEEIDENNEIVEWIEKRTKYCTEHEFEHYLQFLESTGLKEIYFGIRFFKEADDSFGFLPFISPIGTMDYLDYIITAIAPGEPSKLDKIVCDILLTGIPNETQLRRELNYE